MAGYIGKSQGVTQVDGYNRTEADDRYVNASGDTITGNLVVAQGASLVKSFANNTEEYLIKGTDQSAYQPYISHTPSYDTPDRGIRMGVWDNNGTKTDWLKIWNGHVTMPYQPHFVVKANYGSHTVLNSVSPDWSVVYRNNGGHFNTSTNTFTVPVTGLYFFRTHALIDKSANSGYNYAYAQFYFNGTLYTDIAHTPSNGTTSYIDIALTAVVYLQAGDTVQARYTTVNGAAFYAGSTYNAFSGYLVS